MSALFFAPVESPVVDWAAAAACDDCGAPAGAPCAPGCSVWASDDLPLVPFVLSVGVAGDDPWAPVPAPLAVPLSAAWPF